MSLSSFSQHVYKTDTYKAWLYSVRAVFKKLIIVLFALVTVQHSALAHPADTFAFHSIDAQRRAMALARELRCPQCENQNLMESNASIAQDLRLEVFRLVDNGHTNDSVIQLMISRYGDFVLYDPPFSIRTFLLWGLPGGIFLLFMGLLIKNQRRSRSRLIYSEKGEDIANLRERVNHSIYQDEVQRLGSVYKDSPELSTEIELELFQAHCSSVSERTLPQNGPKSFALVGLIGAVFLVLLLYSFSGRWEAFKVFQDNPSPIQTLKGEELKEAALQRLQQRIETNPRDLEAWTELGQYFTYNGQYDNALLVYDRIAEVEGEMNPSTLSAKATVLYYQAGQILTSAAKSLLDEALAKDAGEVTALSLLAADHFMNKRYKDAEGLWQKLLDDGRPRINREQIIQALQRARQLSREYTP